MCIYELSLVIVFSIPDYIASRSEGVEAGVEVFGSDRYVSFVRVASGQERSSAVARLCEPYVCD